MFETLANLVRNSRLLIQIILIILVTFVSACNPVKQESNQNVHPYPFVTDEAEQHYEYQEPYPFPPTTAGDSTERTQKMFEEVPSPSPTTGVVTGFLLQSGNDAKPYIADIYLGRTIEAQQPGYDPIIGFSRDTDPHAMQNPETGEFYFSDIHSGKYALIVWNPFNSYIFHNQTTDEFLIIEVKPGEVSDLGILRMP